LVELIQLSIKLKKDTIILVIDPTHNGIEKELESGGYILIKIIISEIKGKT